MANANGLSLPDFRRYFLSNNTTPQQTSALPIAPWTRSILEIFLHPGQEVELASPPMAPLRSQVRLHVMGRLLVKWRDQILCSDNVALASASYLAVPPCQYQVLRLAGAVTEHSLSSGQARGASLSRASGAHKVSGILARLSKSFAEAYVRRDHVWHFVSLLTLRVPNRTSSCFRSTTFSLLQADLSCHQNTHRLNIVLWPRLSSLIWAVAQHDRYHQAGPSDLVGWDVSHPCRPVDLTNIYRSSEPC